MTAVLKRIDGVTLEVGSDMKHVRYSVQAGSCDHNSVLYCADGATVLREHGMRECGEARR